MKFSVTILGSSAGVPTLSRSLPAQVVQFNERLFLIDCGEGTQVQMQKFGIKPHRISHIFISHLHGDHYLGLAGLLSSMNLQGRTQPLSLFAPYSLAEVLTLQFRSMGVVLRFPLHFFPLPMEQPAVIFEDDLLLVRCFPLVHLLPTVGFLFQEKPRERNLIKERLPKDMPFALLKALKRGENVTWQDTFYHAEEVTLPPPLPRSYAYCSDTLYHEPLAKDLQGVNLLYHEATFQEALADHALKTTHSTARQAAMLALKAQAKKLIIGHFSARYKDVSPLLTEARAVFLATEAVEDGAVFEIA
ncbi:MAG: ribonuclease Z [Bernardetiaceae bacterium]|nr:ribonuclease Z [Bernardetiaceae bacterium]